MFVWANNHLPFELWLLENCQSLKNKQMTEDFWIFVEEKYSQWMSSKHFLSRYASDRQRSPLLKKK